MRAIDPRSIARREFLRRGGVSLGSIALLHLLGRDQAYASLQPEPRAKNVIFLFMAGGPSQFELFEPKDTLQRLDGQTPPASLTSGKRFAFIDPGRAKLMGTLLAPTQKLAGTLHALLGHLCGALEQRQRQLEA